MPDSTIQVKQAAFVSYVVANKEATRRFYEAVLNLKPSSIIEEGKNFAVEYDLNGTVLNINNYGKKEDHETPTTMVALEVVDFDQTIAFLKSVGVDFHSETIDTPVCKMCTIKDPEGNGIIIHKRNPGH